MGALRKKIRRFIVHGVLHADDSPHVLALGVSIGVFFAFLPLIGLQMFLAIGAAALLRANKAVCVPLVWITNPLTITPIYYFCWRTGLLALRTPAADGKERLDEIVRFAAQGSLLDLQFWSDLFLLLMGLGKELWLGSLIISIVFSVPSYFLVRWAVSAHRQRRQRRIQRRMNRRKNTSRPESARAKIARQSEPA